MTAKEKMIKLKMKKVKDDVPTPFYATEGSSGFDIAAYIQGPMTINPRETRLIPTGLMFEIPPYLELQIRPRSGKSATTKLRICNSPGTIDSDFRSEIRIIVENTGVEDLIIQPLERIAQGVISPIFQVTFKEVDELESTERGSNGFGSSDKK